MSIDNVILSVNRVPEILMNTGTDWVALGGILLTAIVVVSGTIITGFQFSRTIKSQERMAAQRTEQVRDQSRSENLARNRQEWINSLRSEVAKFLSVAHEIYNLSGDVKEPKIRGVTGSEISESWEKHNVKADKFYSYLATARFHASNIKMHLNPAENDTRILEGAMDRLICAAYENQGIYDDSVTVIDISRKILKSEWVRVKEMI